MYMINSPIKKKTSKIFFVLKKKKLKKRPYYKLRRPYYKFQRPSSILFEKIKDKKYREYGILRITTNKRNIFCTLSGLSGYMYASISSGLLKVKGRKRMALHIVRATGQLIINQILKRKINTLILIHKGKAYQKKKKTLLKTFAIVKKFKFLKVQRPVPRSHNGCRPSKMRRK